MKRITKDELSFVISSFIIWSIIEIVIDLFTGVTFAEMLTVKYIVCYLAGALGFALVFTLVFKVLNLFPDKKKEITLNPNSMSSMISSQMKAPLHLYRTHII